MGEANITSTKFDLVVIDKTPNSKQVICEKCGSVKNLVVVRSEFFPFQYRCPKGCDKD